MSWLDADATARMLVEPDGCIVWLNASAQRMVDQRTDVLQRRQNRLTSVRRPDHARLAAFLEGGGNRMLVLTPDGGGRALILRGAFVDGWTRPVAAMVLHEPPAPGAIVLADLRPHFGLTTAESNVATRLVNGQTVDGIAESTGVSAETVRTHVRKLYGKLDVGTREELFATLFPYMGAD